MSDVGARQEARVREVMGAPAPRRLGVSLLSTAEGEVVAALPFDPANCTLGEVVHGGVIATLADVSGVAAAIFGLPHVPERGGTATLSLSFLAPAVACGLEARARLLKGGRRQCVSRVSIATPEGAAIAEAHVATVFA